MDTKESTDTNTFGHTCWECGRQYFNDSFDKVECDICVYGGRKA